MSDWAEPGCHAVADGVFRIPLPMPGDGLRAVNVYALETADGLALIDGGLRSPQALAELRSALAAAGHRLDQIHDVYVTHSHHDHYPLAVELRRRFGTRVHLGWAEAPGLRRLLAEASNVPLTALAQLRRSGDHDLARVMRTRTEAEPFDDAGWAEPDVWLDPGRLPVADRMIDAVHTPGHTKGHFVFHDLGGGLLFSGDHLLPTISPSIGFELGEWELPLAQYQSSLRRILDRPDARLLPAHGAPTSSAHARAAELLEHHEVRLLDTRRALDRCGSATAAEVARLLSWTRRGRSYAELDDFNRMIATCETIAHLDVLVERGEARVDDVPAGEVFSLAA